MPLCVLDPGQSVVFTLLLQAAARNAPQLTREQIRQMRRAHDPNFKEREPISQRLDGTGRGGLQP